MPGNVGNRASVLRISRRSAFFISIAQLAPLYESVPPKFYGGTERVVSYLTEELIRRGHDVTLFASGDSKTSGKLYAGHSKCNRSSPCASFLDAL